jgi:hypothetical protein
MQDPVASLRREVRKSQAWLPAGFKIVAWYWDVESGGLDLEQRSQGDNWQATTGAGIPATEAWPTCSAPPAHRSRRSRS